jgi:hypothetical protein
LVAPKPVPKLPGNTVTNFASQALRLLGKFRHQVQDIHPSGCEVTWRIGCIAPALGDQHHRLAHLRNAVPKRQQLADGLRV